MTDIVEIKPASRMGRPAVPNQYRSGSVDGKECVVGTFMSKGKSVDFYIDKEDEERVKTRQWYAATGGVYVGTNVTVDGKRKTLCLHNFIMNRIVFPGKGAKKTVDHINRNGLDNRKANLRIATQTQQNLNQLQKPRRQTNLPETCGITREEIPKHIWYIKANGNHGDRFGIDLKTEGIKWKSSSSKTIPLREKLEEAKRKLLDFYTQYPHLNPT